MNFSQLHYEDRKLLIIPVLTYIMVTFKTEAKITLKT